MLVINALASLRLTFAGIVWLAAAALWILDSSAQRPTSWIAPPLGLLALNLLAAVSTNPVFRRQLPLLMFHLALLSLIGFAAIGRLTYLSAAASVVTGQAFDGHLERIEAGPLHGEAYRQVRFENLGFEISYGAGLKRDKTVNRVRWADPAGIPQTTEIGDITPLVIGGYRFYTTPNKGFAAILRWSPEQGPAELGSIAFPSYPLYADNQTTLWRLDGRDLTVRLLVPELVIALDRADAFKLPDTYRVSIVDPLRSVELRPGESIAVAGGRVELLGLTTWMGYNVFYDWTIPWLLASSTLAVLALAWFYWEKFARKPWRAE